MGPSKNATLGYDLAVITGGRPSVATERDTCLPPAATDDGCAAAGAGRVGCTRQPPLRCARAARARAPRSQPPPPPRPPPARPPVCGCSTAAPSRRRRDLAAMTAAAKALRLDTASLVPVKQAGCTYAGAAP